MTNHPHIATPYELQAAAERRLKVIAFPLLGKMESIVEIANGKSIVCWRWHYTLGETFYWNPGAVPFQPIASSLGNTLSGLDHLPYKEGDRIYLKEEYVALHTSDFCLWTWMAKSKYYAEGYKDEDYPSMDGYYPAKNMDQQHAHYWFAIASVRVCQCAYISEKDIIDAGLGEIKIVEERLTPEWQKLMIERDEKVRKTWNAAYPEQPWHGDRWIVALEVEETVCN